MVYTHIFVADGQVLQFVKPPPPESTADKEMKDLVKLCREQFDIYEKLYFEFGLAFYKEDINKQGQKQVWQSVIIYFFILFI